MSHLRSSLAVCVSLVLSASLSATPQFGSDSCSTPDVVPPSGSITFFNVGATTGPQGQGWTMCDFVPTTGPTPRFWLHFLLFPAARAVDQHGARFDSGRPRTHEG